MKTVDDKRSDPDGLLRSIGKTEGEGKRGMLRVFFGMAAGCGKTYAMLTAAHAARAEGLDVVAGYIEAHGRADIERLAEGIPTLPRRKAEHRGVALEEMDLDALLARRPDIALVDELAHTNAPESRHPKRYQDVLDLLDAGISVYTTLNVQHLESRAETVREITGVPVRETLPDSVLERADEIELVDISPEELRKRLFEGKIYPMERIKSAGENFFEFGNLTALREMALRFTAEKVDHSLQDYRRMKKMVEPWKTGERLLVAISPSPFSESLIRWTRRMAYSLDAVWIAVNVETSSRLSLRDQERLQKHIALARDLGAEIVIIRDEDVTNGILRIARQRNVTQIVAGKPGSGSWRDLFRPRSPVRRLIKESGNIDLCIIRSDDRPPPSPEREDSLKFSETAWKHYPAAFAVLAAVVLANYLALPYIGPRAVALILLLSVLVMAIFVTRGAVFFYAALSALAWNFLFLPPQFTFLILNIDDVAMFLMYFVIALVAGSLTSRLRAHEKAARKREEQLNMLYGMTKQFVTSSSVQDAAEYVVSFITKTHRAQTALYLKTEKGGLSASPHPSSTAVLDEKGYSVASFSFANRRSAGRYTDTLQSSPFLFIPLYFIPVYSNRENIMGVMAICFPADAVLSMNQMTVLETLAVHLALVIEREFLAKNAEKTRIIEESEKLYRVLLSQVTHELRTPLTAIKGSISAMMDGLIAGNADRRNRLLSGLHIATERLIRLVDNLLDMSRIESGRMTLNLDWNDLSDLIGVVMERLREEARGHEISVSCPSDIPLVKIDFNLIAQALHNIIHNALVHTPEGTAVSITVSRIDKGVAITVEDTGEGLQDGETEKLFDKFYRSPAGRPHAGLGLGLSIARGIVELHGGSVHAEGGVGHGARFIIMLPVDTTSGSVPGVS